MNGKFVTSRIKEHYVMCANCNELYVSHLPTQKQAIESAREDGWRIRGGLWCCPNCLNLDNRESAAGQS